MVEEARKVSNGRGKSRTVKRVCRVRKLTKACPYSLMRMAEQAVAMAGILDNEDSCSRCRRCETCANSLRDRARQRMCLRAPSCHALHYEKDPDPTRCDRAMGEDLRDRATMDGLGFESTMSEAVLTRTPRNLAGTLSQLVVLSAAVGQRE